MWLLQVMLLAQSSHHHHHHHCSCQKGSSCLLALLVRARGGCLCVCLRVPTGHQDTGDVVVHLPGVLLLALVLAESTHGGEFRGDVAGLGDQEGLWQEFLGG